MKQSKAAVRYTDVAMNPSERCEVCEHYEGLRSCSEVIGTISTAGWCEVFEDRDRAHQAQLRRQRGASS